MSPPWHRYLSHRCLQCLCLFTAERRAGAKEWPRRAGKVMSRETKLQPSVGDETQADCWSRLWERSEPTWGVRHVGSVTGVGVRSEGRGGMAARGTLGRGAENSHQILPSRSGFAFKEITWIRKSEHLRSRLPKLLWNITQHSGGRG